MSKLINMLGEYYFGTESFKESKRNQAFLREFYEGTLEVEIERGCSMEAILGAKLVPLMWQIGGAIYLCAGGERVLEMAGLMAAGELWRIGFAFSRKSNIAYARKVKKMIIEFHWEKEMKET